MSPPKPWPSACPSLLGPPMGTYGVIILLSYPGRLSTFSWDEVWSAECRDPSSRGERAPCVLGRKAGENTSIKEPGEEMWPHCQPYPGPPILVLGPVGQSLYCPHRRVMASPHGCEDTGPPTPEPANHLCQHFSEPPSPPRC